MSAAGIFLSILLLLALRVVVPASVLIAISAVLQKWGPSGTTA